MAAEGLGPLSVLVPVWLLERLQIWVDVLKRWMRE